MKCDEKTTGILRIHVFEDWRVSVVRHSHHVDQDFDIFGLPPGYPLLCRHWQSCFAICLMLFRKFREKPNRDHTMPYRRVEAVWKELYNAGLVDRAFNFQRWMAVRDWLSQQGHIDWIDERYQPGKRACKWHIDDKLYDLLIHIERGGDFANTSLVGKGSHAHKTPRLAIVDAFIDEERLREQEKVVEMLFAA